MRRFFSFFDPAREGFAKRMLRLVLVLALVPIALLCGTVFLSLRSETGRYATSRALIRADLPGLARPFAASLSKEFPDRWEYLRVEAWALRRSGRIEDSLAVYDRAVEALPDEWWAHSHRCFFNALLADPIPFMDACDRAIALEPSLPHMAYYRRAFARLRAGNPEGAEADLELAEDLWPDERDGPQRDDASTFLEALRAGRNPLDAEALERERSRY